jgi:hypothetical protein
MPELPPPLPPGERTVGQLIAETIRAYGRHFWASLPLGLALAIVDQARAHHLTVGTALIFWAATPLMVAAYVRACCTVLGTRVGRDAVVVAVLVYLPFPALLTLFVLPGLAWFAFAGLAVPAALVERLPVRQALARGRELGRADFVHSFGSLCALVVVVGVAEQTLSVLLDTQGGSSLRVALFLADLVLTPLLFLGGAMLYGDQAARVGSARPDRRSRDADLHPAVDPDPARRPDAEGKS